MPAPNLETLFDYESQLESAFADLLTAQNINAITTDSTEILDTPRVEIVATITAMGPHQAVVPTGNIAGQRVYDQIAASVDLSLVVDLSNGQDVKALRGKLRKFALFVTGASLNAKLSYLYVAEDSFMQTAGSRAVEDGEGSIRLTSTLSLQAFIRSSAWPTT